jgi:alkylation response protein AidB-like acyl-CoA dehydrogenase
MRTTRSGPNDHEEWRQWVKAWARLLADHGFAGRSWPKVWGGMELSLSEQIAYHEDMTRARMPRQAVGLGIVGLTILRFGSPEQHDRYLPLIVRAEEDRCLGYSGRRPALICRG